MFAQEPTGTSTVTFGAGGNFVASGFIASQTFSNSPDFIGGYEFRIQKYVAAEVAIDAAFPRYSLYLGDGRFALGRTHNMFVPFGPRLMFPIHQGRIEVYAGGGGAHVWHGGAPAKYWAGESPGSLKEWLWQVNAGGRFALDSKRRFWVGSTVRYYRDGLGTSSEQYLSWTGDIGFRFGR